MVSAALLHSAVIRLALTVQINFTLDAVFHLLPVMATKNYGPERLSDSKVGRKMCFHGQPAAELLGREQCSCAGVQQGTTCGIGLCGNRHFGQKCQS